MVIGIPTFTLYAWIRALVWYPIQVYGNRFYVENLNRFRFPKNAERYGRLRILRWFSEKKKVNVLALFGYNQIGIYLYVDLESEKYNDRFTAIKVAMERIIEGYKEFKKYFLEEICPPNIQEVEGESFDFKAEKLLIDLSEFFDGINTRQRNAILRKRLGIVQSFTLSMQ